MIASISTPVSVRPTKELGSESIRTLFLLTLLDGGALATKLNGSIAAIRRALAMMSSSGLDVRFVSYGTPSREIVQIAKDFA
jgi:hypothetical protein